jgi:hypothetical protein
MDPELFKRQLEKFAELQQVKTPRTPAIREKDELEVIFRGGDEFTVGLNNNPTLNVGIKQLKPHIAVCEDCRQVVENRVVEIKVYDCPETHWRRHCKACKFSQNPFTKKYDLTIKRSHYVNDCYQNGKPEPEEYEETEEELSHLKPVFKKPAK